MAFGQSIRFAKAFVEVGMDATMAQKQLRQFRNQMRSMKRIGIGVGTAVTAALTPIAGALAKAVKHGAAFEETLSKFNVVFGKLTPQVNRFVTEMVNGLGQSRAEMMRFTSEFQDLLVPLGGAPKQAAELSTQLTKLAVDLGSFNNRETADVFRDLSSALTGMVAPMKKYGVVVNEAAVKQELLRQGMDPKEATQFQKVMARINIIMKSTTAAHDDFARTQQSLTNQWKIFNNQVENTLTEIGEKLLPEVNAQLQRMNELLAASTPLLRQAADVAGSVGQASRGAGAGIFNLSPANLDLQRRGRLEREAARRQGGFFTRYGSLLGGGALISAMLDIQEGNLPGALTMMSDAELSRQLARSTNRQQMGQNMAAQAEARRMRTRQQAQPQAAGGGLGAIGRAGVTLAGDAQRLAGAFFGRRMQRAMTRVFAPPAIDAKRAIQGQIRGMKLANQERLQNPISSHEIFTNSAFGGDFLARGNRQGISSAVERTAKATEEMLEYIKAHSVVFG